MRALEYMKNGKKNSIQLTFFLVRIIFILRKAFLHICICERIFL